jgi:hypothetical protein
MRELDCVHQAHEDTHFTAETDERSSSRFSSIAMNFIAR